MQCGEAVFVAEVRAHIVLQQVAYWGKREAEKHINGEYFYSKNRVSFVGLEQLHFLVTNETGYKRSHFTACFTRTNEKKLFG